MRRSSRTGYTGCYPTKNGKFLSVYERKGQRRRLGVFDSAIEAAEKHDAYVREHLAERGGMAFVYAHLNFPNDTDRQALREAQDRDAEKARAELALRENALRMKPVTETQREQIARLTTLGVLAPEIATRLGLHTDNVLSVIRQLRHAQEETDRLLAEKDEADLEDSEQVRRIREGICGARETA